MQDIFSGGTDTSSATLECAMSELMKNPRLLLKAQSDVFLKTQYKHRYSYTYEHSPL
jgi:cytochrome P450 family 71 subfamily A